MNNMGRYISDCIEEFQQANPETMFKNVATPATHNLFKIRNKEELIGLNKSRVTAPMEDDWKK